MDPITLALMGGSIGADLLGGWKGSDGAEKAAAQAADATREASKARIQGLKKGMTAGTEGYDQSYDLLDAGYDDAIDALGPQRWDATDQLYADAEGGYEGYLGRMRDGFEASPGYQFRLDQGLEAAKSLANAQGNLYGGNTLAALNNYAQGQASDEWARYWGQGEDYQNRIYGMSGREMDQAGQISGLKLGETNALAGNKLNRGLFRGQMFENIGDARAEGIYGAGMAQATGTQNSANAWTNALNNVGNTMGYFGGQMQGYGKPAAKPAAGGYSYYGGPR